MTYPTRGAGRRAGPGGIPGPWVGLSAVAVAVVAFVITAFIAPGFLVGGSDDGANGNGGAAGSGAHALAQQVIDRLKNHDPRGLEALACRDADEVVGEVIGDVNEVSDARLGMVNVTGEPAVTATARLTIAVEGEPLAFTAHLTGDGQRWCWRSLSAGDSARQAATTGSAEVRAATDAMAELLVGGFLDAVNAGDQQRATSTVCRHDRAAVAATIQQVTAAAAKLSVSDLEGERGGSGSYYTVELTGTVDGRETYGVLGVSANGAEPCVSNFAVY